MSDKAWVVVGESGCWEHGDLETWVVRAFLSEADAASFVESLDANVLSWSRSKEDRKPAEMHRLDPHPRSWAADPAYKVAAVPVGSLTTEGRQDDV